MLVLTRKSNQSIMIGDDIEVSVLSIMGEKVRIGIQAPRDIPVFRKEVYLEIQQEHVASAGSARAEVDDALKKLVLDMAETMYAAPGIGLAATQVDVHKQVIVVDVSERRDSLVVLINPEIVEATGVSDIEEGCLSVPGVYELVERAERVKVRAYDQNGNAFTLEAQGLLAVCIQHEIDHLKGKVFVEYLSQLKQQRIRARIAKQLRKSA